MNSTANYNISWTLSQESPYSFHFLVSISSSHSDVLRTVKNSSFLQDFDNNTLYEINVFVCHNESRTSQFVFGKAYNLLSLNCCYSVLYFIGVCSFYKNSTALNLLLYYLNDNGTSVAVLHCEFQNKKLCCQMWSQWEVAR